MKLALIGPFAFKPKGTVGARAFLIGQALAARGHDVTLLLPPYDNPADSGRAWTSGGIRVENARLTRDDLRQRLTVPAALARRAARLRPDLVHLFKPIGYSGQAGVYLSCFSRLPLVVDTDDWEGTGGWAEIHRRPAAERRLIDWQERWLARHAAAVTVASRTLQTQVWGFGVDPVRVHYLPNGPDPALRAAVPPSQAEVVALRAQLGVGAAPLALYLGQVPAGTDLDLALDALAEVRRTLPDARLIIAGVGDGLPGLRDRAVRLGLAGQVLFPGWVEPAQALLYLAAAGVVVNPYRDSLVNRSKCAGKIVQAMALGRPIVTSRLGENLEYIQDGSSGLLTEPGDPAGLARAMLAVLSDPAFAARLGAAARRRIWERFDWEPRVAELEQLYSDITLGTPRES